MLVGPDPALLIINGSPMFKSIRETRKLFTVEGLAQGGQVNIKTSKYLLSLPREKQAEVLSAHLAHLKKDLAAIEDLIANATVGEGGHVNRAQLQLLIQITRGLLEQV